MMKDAKPLRFYGGKQKTKAKWINALLPPPAKESVYVEPYGGMAGVMMRRMPSGAEIYNDINRRLVNWWRVVKYQGEELARLVELTPNSRDEFELAREQVDDMRLAPIERALAYQIIITQGTNAGDAHTGWKLHISPNVTSVKPYMSHRIAALGMRMREVQIENLPGVEVLAYMARYEEAVVYVDPPYPSADNTPYLHAEIDKDELTAVLLKQRGFCAVSGFGDEWEHLGWDMREKAVTFQSIYANERTDSGRIERLWCNREPAQKRLI